MVTVPPLANPCSGTAQPAPVMAKLPATVERWPPTWTKLKVSICPLGRVRERLTVKFASFINAPLTGRSVLKGKHAGIPMCITPETPLPDCMRLPESVKALELELAKSVYRPDVKGGGGGGV